MEPAERLERQRAPPGTEAPASVGRHQDRPAPHTFKQAHHDASQIAADGHGAVQEETNEKGSTQPAIPIARPRGKEDLSQYPPDAQQKHLSSSTPTPCPMSISPDGIPIPQNSPHQSAEKRPEASHNWAAHSGNSASLVPPFPPVSAGPHNLLQRAHHQTSNAGSSEHSSPLQGSITPSIADQMVKMASQAGLHSVSSALATQAQAHIANPTHNHPAAQGPAPANSKMTSSSTMPPSTPASTRQTQSLSGGQNAENVPQSTLPTGSAEEEQHHGYTALLNAHMISALTGARRISASSTLDHEHPGSSAMAAAAIAAQAQMANIATQVATEESEKQLRLQALLRASGHVHTLASQVQRPTGGTRLEKNTSSAQTSLKSPQPPAASTQTSHLSSDQSVMAPRDTAASTSSSPVPSAGNRLQANGLGHVQIPSQGVEQAWGRVDDGSNTDESEQASGRMLPLMSKFYNPSDAMAGVPSLPLMPTPPLVMLPPPTVPPFSRPTGSSLGAHVSSTGPYARTLNYIEATEPPHFEAIAAHLSHKPAALQVIQSPNGTTKAGWWINPEEQSGSTGDEGSNHGVTDGRRKDSRGDSHIASSCPPTFQTSCVVDQDTYAALATQAAYATSLLTTATSSVDTNADQAAAKPHSTPSVATHGRRMQPLSVEQYESMKNQLTAWAGLHGPELQAEAQQLLEARKINILNGSIHTLNGLADPNDPSQASAFFPPDFASHFQAQLQALTAGVYRKKYQESFDPGRFVGPHTHEGATGSQNARAGAETGSVTDQESSQWQPSARRDGQAAHGDNRNSGHVEAAILQRAHSLGMSPEAVSVVMDHAAPPQAPRPTAEAHDPMQLVSVASTETGSHAQSDIVLDKLLRLAHQLYQTGGRIEKDANGKPKHAMHPTLLALLHTLHKMHPTHLPTLLLLSCAYYSEGDYAASLFWNDRILMIDPDYVEAMSNIGTTLRALGKTREAESWWARAIKLKPGYWDAFENLLGVLCAPQRQAQTAASPEGAEQVSYSAPRFSEALRLCEQVESHVMSKASSTKHMAHKVPQSNHSRATSLPSHLPASSLPRLQQLFWAKGNIKYILAESSIPAAAEYKKVVEIVTSPSDRTVYTLRDLIVATCILGLLSLGASLGQSAAANGALQVLTALNLDTRDPTTLRLAASAHWSKFHPEGLLGLVHAAGDRLVLTLRRLGGGTLPTIMLMPEHTSQLANLLFHEFGGQLPSVVVAARAHGEVNYQKALQLCNQTTSTTLLTLAKHFQDATANPVPSKYGVLSLDGIPASISLVLPLYYLSLALAPSASTCNNLGILLSTLPIKIQSVDQTGVLREINGQGMAMHYYNAGINMDRNHPHLYTNLGSLLKDLGNHHEAIAQYEKAIAIRGDFDVALANLANSLRDISRTEASLPYYRRALEANPNAKMPEAMCGLLNGLLSLNDWRETFCEGGLLVQVMELVEKQLKDGSSYGAGAFQSSGSLVEWTRYVTRCLDDSRPEMLQVWANRLAVFFRQSDRALHHASARQAGQSPGDEATDGYNEGGFLLRLIEYLHKRSQQRWYRDMHGHIVAIQAGDSSAMEQASHARDGMAPMATNYPRTMLPTALIAPSVPTVLPFHTFSYGIEGIMSARAMRLISHRNALRISQNSLSQSWLPPHVYPPPAPPAPKINIGYVSSDFNNHPLAHLMQSVFGYHDLSRFNVYLYATSPSDQSPYRKKIESEAHHFVDVSQRSTEQIVTQILNDGIHILMNLNGYTKGARNEIFAARPCPVQMHFMGFAGGMASGWTDYVVADTVVCPPEVTSVELWNKRRRQAGGAQLLRPTDLPGNLDPEDPSNSWMYTERFIYMPHSYFVNDHKQGFREPETRRSDIDGSIVHPHEMTAEEAWTEEEERRWKARKELFPGVPDDFVIFATFNQLYKNEPTVFKAWLEILKRVPNSILWLLRFPAEGEPNVIRTAREWGGDEICSRIVFTDIAPKEEHIRRGRVADLFLDTFEVNAHTTACDCLWSGTPIVTLPKWKFKQASLVAASIVRATGCGDQMIVGSVDEYIDRVAELAESVQYQYVDAEGKVLQPVPPAKPVKASELLRLGASAKLAAEAQQQAATAGPQGRANEGNASHQPARAGMNGTNSGTVPAPVTVQQTSMHTSKSAVEAVSPPRESMILTQARLQAPEGTASRRGSGELLELRKRLYTTRDTSPLFDTEQWTRDLEKGYIEAWRRWSLGTDAEESVEWDALSEAEKERDSGHIYVNRL